MYKILIAGPVGQHPEEAIDPTLEALNFFAQDTGTEVWCSLNVDDVKKADGIIIPGGISDVCPERWGEEDISCFDVNKELDQMQYNIIQEGFKQKKAILGICRGHQLVNAFLGGSLIQDIKSSQLHKYVAESPRFHDVYNIPGSKLFEIFNEKMYINSAHHQAIKRIADDLRPVQIWCEDLNKLEKYFALAEQDKLLESTDDCIIEGVIHKNHPYLGLQWHPELSGKFACDSKTVKKIREYLYHMISI